MNVSVRLEQPRQTDVSTGALYVNTERECIVPACVYSDCNIGCHYIDTLIEVLLTIQTAFAV